MQKLFLGIAAGLFGMAVLLAMGQQPYYPTSGGGVPNNIIGPLTCGLAIAGGLALIAAALDRSSGSGPGRPTT